MVACACVNTGYNYMEKFKEHFAIFMIFLALIFQKHKLANVASFVVRFIT